MFEKEPVIPMNAGYLYLRRYCANIDGKLDCEIMPNDACCPFNESTENTCPNYTKKKRDDVVIKVIKQGHYLVIKNGITEHFHKKFNCMVCSEIKPVNESEKCPKCPLLPESLANFKCDGVCYEDQRGKLTISRQPEIGWIFCYNACPKYKMNIGDKQNIPLKTIKPAAKPKKEQPKLF